MLDNLKKSLRLIWVSIQWFLGVMFILSSAVGLLTEQKKSTDPSALTFFILLAIGLFIIPNTRVFIKTFAKVLFEKVESLLPNFLTKNSKFKKHMLLALEDGALTEEESFQLEKKAKELGVNDDFVKKLRQSDFLKRANPIIEKIEESRRFSIADENELKTISDNLKITTNLPPEFKMYRDLWEYEDKNVFPLVPIPPNIILQKNEECFFQTQAVWKQLKIVTERKGYVGASVGFRVAKGVRFSVGRAVPVGRKYEEIQPLSDGEICITNKKIVFNGDRKSTNITMTKIIQVELYKDGIEIRKTSGKPDYFKMSRIEAEYLAAIIHNILNTQT